MKPLYTPRMTVRREEIGKSMARIIKPLIIFSEDVNSYSLTATRLLGRGMLIGMMGMTYESDITISI